MTLFTGEFTWLDGDIEPLVVRPKTAKKLLSCGDARLYAWIGSGELESYLDGKARMITMRSIKAKIARGIELAAASPNRQLKPLPPQQRQRADAAAKQLEQAEARDNQPPPPPY